MVRVSGNVKKVARAAGSHSELASKHDESPAEEEQLAANARLGTALPRVSVKAKITGRVGLTQGVDRGTLDTLHACRVGLELSSPGDEITIELRPRNLRENRP